jgi:hypothetical protein
LDQGFEEFEMSQKWYMKRDGKTVGPIASAKMKQLAGAGRISPETRLKLGNDGGWVVASKVEGLFADAVVDQKNPRTLQCELVSPAADLEATESQPESDVPSAMLPEQAGSANPYQSPASAHRLEAVHASGVPKENEPGIAKAFLTIWFRPRQTIRWAIDHRPGRDAILLVMLAFSLKFFDNVLSGEARSIAPVLSGCLERTW